MSMTATYGDGNAIAGPMSEVFGFDLTTAQGKCADCGHLTPLAAGHLFTSNHGLVLRCPMCEHALLRLAIAGGNGWLDLAGLAYTQFERP